MDEDYDRPGRPLPYGAGRPLTDEERAFFAGLKSTYWKTGNPDNSGRSHMYPEGVLMRRETERLANLILECRLPTVIGSGMFCLPGYSMAILDSPDPQGMSVPKPDTLMILMNSHMHWDRDERGTTHQRSWIFFTGFTHSPENLVLLDFYGLRKPSNRGKYDY